MNRCQIGVCAVAITLAFVFVGSSPIYAQGTNCAGQMNCFNNPACRKPQNGSTPQRTINNTISWDMDSGSFQTSWAWDGVLTAPNFEGAQTHAAFEWGSNGNLVFDQRDSCAQARATGNGVICSQMNNWCKMVDREGLTALLLSPAVAIPKIRSNCGDLPAGWICRDSTKVVYGGWVAWKDHPDCGGGNIVVGLPINPDPNANPPDPRMRGSCRNRKLPGIARVLNIKHVSVHEFGHGLSLADTGQSCLPSATVMEQYNGCELLLPCPQIFITASDRCAVRFLYGP